MTVRIVLEEGKGSAARWDAFVRSQPNWSHFHLYGWRGIMERVLKHECLYLSAVTDDGALVGVLPLVRVKSVLFGHYLVSMPFLNYGGPLGSDEAVVALTQHAARLASEQRVKMLELRSRGPLPVDLPVSHRKITVLLDMPAGGMDALWKGFDAKVRSQVRRPQKDGVTVAFGADQVGPFFDVFSEHMRDLGTPTQPRALFEAIAETFPDEATFGCAYHQGRPIACGCGFQWGSEFEITWASALRAYNKLSPNMLLYWEFMQRAGAAGATIFNFGRCTPNGGTHKFKKQWGTRDEPLWWYEQRADGATTPAEGHGALGLAPKIWQKLPLPLATALGPHIVRFIP
ncbi:MAG TPA: FemAB family XrtA/PEP-CTERM system-associated protein [Gemmatimonadaceae bacterium]|nr:FemAB family XrtA/PEP-CTERM system-associated protein [Gemmatimonadaceae bacterium]